MVRHLITAAIGAFWLTMVILLWRTESGSGGKLVSSVPLEAVVERILNAADPSTLRLTRQGQDLGQLRWLPSIREHPPETNSLTPEGMVSAATGYHIDVDLTLKGNTPDARWYVVGQVDLDLKHQWEELVLRLIQRPTTWELRSSRGEDSVELIIDEGRGKNFRQRFSREDLNQIPAALGPVAAFLPPGLGLTPLQPSGTTNGPAAPAIRWQASDGELRVGRHSMRAFRIEGRILEHFTVVAYISRAGELLRVELPDHYLLQSVATPTDQ
jgi:hypothetical protein